MKFDIKEWSIAEEVTSAEISQKIVSAIDENRIEDFPEIANINKEIMVVGLPTTPLMYAAAKGSPEMVQHIILLGANVNPTELAEGRGPLDTALSASRHEIVDVLLENAAECTYISAGQPKSKSYLEKYAVSTSAECLKSLINFIYEKNQENSHKIDDLLRLAIEKDSGDLCALLLKKIVELPDSITISEYTTNAYTSNFQKIKKIIPLAPYAISMGSYHAFKALCESGRVDINKVYSIEMDARTTTTIATTLLIWAIKCGKTEIATYLCSLPNIDVNLCDPQHPKE